MKCRILLSLLVLIAAPMSASAQQTVSSAFGNQTIGGGSPGLTLSPTSSGTSGLGSSQMGSSFGGNSSLGGGNSSLGGTGGTGLGAGLLGGTAMTGANGGFVGAGRGQGTFIGQQSANNTGAGGAQANRGMTTAGRGGAFNQVGRGGMGGGNFGGGGFGNSNVPVLPTRLTIGFEFQPTAAPVVTQELNRKFQAIKQFSAAGVSVEMQQRTAVLRGTVKTQAQKDLAGRIAKLDPAISDVVNELTVE